MIGSERCQISLSTSISPRTVSVKETCHKDVAVVHQPCNDRSVSRRQVRAGRVYAASSSIKSDLIFIPTTIPRTYRCPHRSQLPPKDSRRLSGLEPTDSLLYTAITIYSLPTDQVLCSLMIRFVMPSTTWPRRFVRAS